MAVIPSIVEQHAQEAAFLGLLRSRAVCAPHYSLRDLVKLDYRLDANLDGLILAEDFGWTLCEQLLTEEGAVGVFTGIVVAISTGDQARIRQVMEWAASQNLSRGLVAELGWLPFARIKPHIDAVLTAELPAMRRVGIAACAIHGEYPGMTLLKAVLETDPLLKARALRAAGELGQRDLVYAAEDFLDSEDEAVRFAAAWSVALRRGTSRAIETLTAMSDAGSRFSEYAAQVAMRRMDAGEAKTWLLGMSQNGCHRLAIAAAGALGDPDLIPWLILQMGQTTLARAAGEAFTLITGADLTKENLAAERPGQFETDTDEDPENENVSADADEDLPWPAPALVQSWWNAHANQFQMDTRYLLGKRITAEWATGVLQTGRQRQRSAAALELAILEPHTPLFNIKTPVSASLNCSASRVTNTN